MPVRQDQWESMSKTKIKSAEAKAKADEAQDTMVKREKKEIVEKIRSKSYQSAKSKITPGKSYPIKEAIKLVKEISYSKFEGTLEMHIVVKKAGISANLSLPHQAGKTKKIEVADDETIEKLKKGMIDFDILVSTMEIMPKLVPFARLLGPKGLMPNAKNGTLVSDPKKASAFTASSVTLKTEKEAPLIHTVIGKVNQKDTEIEENIEAIIKALGGSKQIVRVFLKSTMSPSVKLTV